MRAMSYEEKEFRLIGLFHPPRYATGHLYTHYLYDVDIDLRTRAKATAPPTDALFSPFAKDFTHARVRLHFDGV